MSEGSPEQHSEGRGHWKPVTPISAMVAGRLVLGVPGAIGLTIIVVTWSAITGAGLSVGRAVLFSLVAVTAREIIDVSAHRLIMRAWRSQDAHGLLLTLIAVLCPAVAGFLAARILVPASTTALTVLTWLPFMAFVAVIERPWDTSLGYDALQERIHQPQPIPPEYVTADFHDGRRYVPELNRETLQPRTRQSPHDGLPDPSSIARQSRLLDQEGPSSLGRSKRHHRHHPRRFRGRRTRLMTREHFAEEIADGRMTFRPIDDEGYLLDEDGNRIED